MREYIFIHKIVNLELFYKRTSFYEENIGSVFLRQKKLFLEEEIQIWFFC